MSLIKRPKGFKGFTFLTIGQILSFAGSGMTQFGLGIWIWKTTHNATPFSIITFAFFVPNMIFSTVAGALVDRLPRKISLVLPDLSAGIVTIITLILFLLNKLNLPFLYIASFVSGAFNTFQWPAYSVTISSMLSKEEYGRANGLFSLTESAPALISPIASGFLYSIIGLHGIMLIDIITFIIAISMVFLVEIPQVHIEEKRESILRDAVFGFRYIFYKRSLLYLLMVFLLTNFFGGFWNTLFTPMILGKFNGSSVILGTVETIFGVGGILGGIIMSVWGGAKKKIKTLLLGIFVGGISEIFIGLSYSVTVLSLFGLLMGIANIFANASSQSIWQSIVPLNLQGRVFSARKFIAQFASAIPMLVSGPLVDNVLSKYFNSNNLLSKTFGIGKGASIGFLAFLSGILSVFVVIWAVRNTYVMSVEDLAQNYEVKEALT
ncbi:MFS transporter [Caldisericum exile]|uniref:Major facilitator superfamily protein n=1 Tax=Caldisericum exile (strain DSM 21853 / NBRC 104410 / AZM16c01) TaxID=511051 RepID=A0A7U6JEU2_CALEA|nr:MFS transporter [Caldisericum exile]BAL80823.1 major facilitator superfamily protein [Caldisericum exile AZM16c01]